MKPGLRDPKFIAGTVCTASLGNYILAMTKLHFFTLQK
jgi:hypothetical protein